jgi:hypothetical protein
VLTDLGNQAVAAVMGSADLVPRDRKRAGLLLHDEIDGFGELGVVAGDQFSFAEAARNRLPAAADRLARVTLTGRCAVYEDDAASIVVRGSACS